MASTLPEPSHRWHESRRPPHRGQAIDAIGFVVVMVVLCSLMAEETASGALLAHGDEK